MEPELFTAASVQAVRAAALGESEVLTVFQPIVSLDNEDVVGFEALSRWPGVSGTSAEKVFAHAEAHGVANQLDRRCTRAAIGAALTAQLPGGSMLLINTEPTTGAPITAQDASLTEVFDRYRLVFELTERDLLTHPRALLIKLAALREAGVAIALDDVGADPDVLAWLEVIDPDIVKLDLSLVQGQTTSEKARILNAIYGFHKRRGALILAEGIETDAHLEQARAVGATLGQGYRFGRPGPGGEFSDACRGVVPELPMRITAPRVQSGTPYDAACKSAAVIRTAGTDLLAALSFDVAVYAERAVDRPIVLLVVRHGDHLSATALRRCRRLARSCSLVALFGYDDAAELGLEVVGVEVDHDDPLGAERALVVLGSHSAFAIIAREHLDAAHPDHARPHPIADGDHRIAFVVTTDRPLITDAATSLLARIPRASGSRRRTVR